MSDSPPRWTHEADYVIVGAGTAGCAIANRLSEDPSARVLLIEAGGSDSHPFVRMPVGFMKALMRPELTWGYQSEPEPHLNQRVIPVPRGRLMGGSSSINGMFHIRGHRRDFDDWARAGCSGWSYAEVLPYFQRSESHALGPSEYHGSRGPLQVRPIDNRHLLSEPLRAAALAAGHAENADYDGADTEGIARGTVAIDERGRRHSSARAYLGPQVRRRHNLQVLSGVLTERVLIDDGRATGVQALQGERRLRIRAHREVVLCAGAYGSPQLLMLSGIGPPEALQAHGLPVHLALPGVGANLIEHPRMPLQFQAQEPVTFLNQLRLDRATGSALRWAVTGSGPFATQICSGTVLLKTDPALDRPDVQLLCNPVRLDARLWLPGVGKAQQHALYITVCQLYARSRGRVSLRSARVQDAPRIRFNLFAEEADRRQMRQAIRLARQLYRTAPMDTLAGDEMLPGGARETDAQLDEAIRELGGITHHPVGTCAMGISDQAVVDPLLRVRGIARLRVADASVMPSIVGGNTNAATLMIAEKAADLILERPTPPAARVTPVVHA